MSKVCYTVIEGETRKIKKKYLVVNGQTHEITRKYIVVNGQTRLCYQNTINISTATVTLGASLTYNGSQQTKAVTVTMDGVTLTQGTDYTVTGNTGTNAGNYTMTITGIGDYEGTVQKAWSIAKASGSISVSPASLTITGDAGDTETATISYTGDGNISVSSSNESIAMASRSGNTITVTLKDSGRATITITLNAGTNYTGASCTIGVTAKVKPIASTSPESGVYYPSTLNALSASDVSLAAEAISNNRSITNATSTVYISGSVHRKLSIGDPVTLALNGTNYVFDIIGFNHDTLTSATAYGAATATGRAGITLQMHDIFATTYPMNSSNTTSGGWKSSDMRTSTMATMRGYLPSAWQSIIKPVNKQAGLGGGSSEGVETVSDSCFLLAEIEIFGSTTHSVSGEGSQYAYYRAGNTAVKEMSGSVYYWWERSPCSGSSSTFCRTSAGNANSSTASANGGVAFGFCV